MTEPAPAPTAASTPAPSLARSAGRFGLATMASRLLGLVREQLFAALVGAGPAADAFVVAFRIPNLLRDLFAEGALSSAFVPTFTSILRQRSAAEAFALANRVMNTLTILLASLVAAGAFWTQELVRAVAGQFPEAQVEHAATLTRIMLPFLPLVSLAAVAMGMLTSLGRFAAPALAPTMFNVASIAVGAGLFVAGAGPETAVVGWSIGTLLGGLAQFAIQVPPLLKAGWRPMAVADLRFRDPGIRRMAALMGPAIVGLAATQVNIVVNTYFASSITGAPAWLSYAFRLMQLPLGVFGVAIGTVATASVAQRAADGDQEGVKRTLGQSLRLVAFLTIPSAVALAVLGEPIVRLIYEHGRFNEGDTAQTALALGAYAAGLYAYSGVKVIAPAFYALDRARIPLVASMTAVAANVALNVVLFPLGFWALALGTSAAALTNFFVLNVGLRRVGASIAGQGLAQHAGKVALASVVAGFAGWGVDRVADRLIGHGALWARLTGTLAALAIGGLAYLVGCRALRIAELEQFIATVRRRVRR